MGLVAKYGKFKCPLNNDVSIVQKHVVKLSNTSTMFKQQMTITKDIGCTFTRKDPFLLLSHI
jgi:hypothetical protein